MHMCAKFDQNIPCGSRIMSIFNNCGRTDSHIDLVIIVQTQGSCNLKESINHSINPCVYI